MLNSELLNNCQAHGDWVLIKKRLDLDGQKKVGCIDIPDTATTNFRESKLGTILSIGKGYFDNKGVFRTFPQSLVGSTVYYTRFGKEQTRGTDGGTYVFTRFRGVLAKVDLEIDEIGVTYPTKITPLWDNLLLEPCYEEETVLASGLILIKKLKDEFFPHKVILAGTGNPKQVGKAMSFDTTIPCTSKVNNIVWATQYNGVDISWYEGIQLKRYKLVSEHECVLIED